MSEKKGGMLWLVVLVLLLGGGFAAWFFLLRGGKGGTSSDFDLVPRDAQAFATVRIADFLKTDLGKKAWTKISEGGGKDIQEFQDKVGLTPQDIERVTAVLIDPKEKLFWVIVNTSKAYDQGKILKSLPNPEEKTHEGKKYHVMKDEDSNGIIFTSEKQLVLGPEKALERRRGLPQKPKSGPLDGAVAVASNASNHLSAGVNATAMMDLLKKGPVPLPASASDLKVLHLSAAIKDQITFEVGAEFTDASKAKAADTEINDALAKAKKALPGMKEEPPDALGPLDPEKVGSQAEKLLSSIKVKQDGAKLVVSASLDTAGVVGLLPDSASGGGKMLPVQAQNNFKQITLAMINHADQNAGKMPAQAIYDEKSGKPLLSWRVAILPQLDKLPLYQQIHLNESWDSPHNKQFWDKMPKAYELPGLPASEGKTAIQVFMGKDTPFEGKVALTFPAGFSDGPSQTILIVEAAREVNWMKPEDIDMGTIDKKNIRASLGNRTGRGTLVGMADGSVRFLPRKLTEETLKAAITPAGNDLLGPDW